MHADASVANGGKAAKAIGILGLIFLSLLGVVMPVLTLAVELTTHMCAELLFDPIPTLWHGMLIAVVPVANLGMILAIRSRGGDRWRLLGWLNALALGISGFYMLLFLPFTPFALLGLLFFGFGALPLSPLTSFITAILLRVRARRLLKASDRPLAGLWGGVAVALLVMAALEAPKVITQAGLQMSVSENAEVRASGLAWLRAGGSRDRLLEACYANGPVAGDVVRFLFNEFGIRVTQEQAREIYYRVTGTPFNMVKPPQSPFGRRSSFWMDFDPNVGGEAVQGRIRGLSLLDSRLDGVVSPDSGVAYSEWTMVFKNASLRQQEARAMILLPPGGVVSRLTLWVDGEEREAAFGGRGKVKEAYQRVVQSRRDPVLVTTAGPDRVLVQCFPVPPNNGTMKIRFGITAPVDLNAMDSGVLRLPHFLEHNFDLPDSTVHGLWVESSGKVAAVTTSTNLVEDMTGRGGYALRGVVGAAALGQPTTIRVARDGGVTEVVAVDKRGETPALVRQTIREASATAPRRLVLAVDGSQRMKAHVRTLAALVDSIPDGMEFSVILAGDRVKELCAPQKASDRSREQASAAIRTIRFAGGCDNVRALERAWDQAAAGPGGAILWLHATQPVTFGGVETLRQRWERRPGEPLLFTLQFGAGPDVVLQALADLPVIRQVGRTGDPAADLAYRMHVWAGRAPAYVYERTRIEATALDAFVKEGSSHIIRLWALDEILRNGASRQEAVRDRAVAMASRYQLVTPVSGAVVLETKEQFKAAGLEPVEGNWVPTVPEPETWMLLAVGLVIVVVMVLRRRVA